MSNPIVDIISSDIGITGAMQFMPAASPEIQVAVTGPGADPILFTNAQGRGLFTAGDSPILKSLWVDFPFGFGQGAGQAIISPAWVVNGGTVFIPEFGADSGTASRLTLPNLCGQIDFPGEGLFLQAPIGVDNDFSLALVNAAFAMNASMINLPADLVGVLIKVQVHCMVIHTKPLRAVP